MDYQNNYQNNYQNKFNNPNTIYDYNRIKYQLLYYKRKEIEKRKKRRELLIRILLVSIFILIFINAYFWYSNNYLTTKPQGEVYNIVVDRVAILQYDSLMTPYVEFNVQFKSDSQNSNVDEQDFSADIKVLGGYNYEVSKLQGSVYSIKVTFDEDNIPNEIQVKVRDNTYTVGIVKDVTLKLLLVKAPNQTVLGSNFKVYIYVQSSIKIDDWKVASNVKFVSGKVTQSYSDNGFVYSFTIVLNADKMVDRILVKVYSKKFMVSKLIALNTRIVDRQTYVTFNIQSDKLMDDPNKDVFTQFKFIIITNYYDTFTIEYKESEHLSVDVQSKIVIKPGQNVIEGRIYLKKSVDEVRKENVILVIRNSNGKIIDKKTITITIYPSTSKIRVSPTILGLTPDNWIKISVDFYSQLKNVEAKIISCTALTNDGSELNCKYGENLIELEYNKITSTEVYVDTSELVERNWKGSITVSINIAFYSHNVEFNKGVTIQAEITLN